MATLESEISTGGKSDGDALVYDGFIYPTCAPGPIRVGCGDRRDRCSAMPAEPLGAPSWEV